MEKVKVWLQHIQLEPDQPKRVPEGNNKRQRAGIM